MTCSCRTNIHDALPLCEGERSTLTAQSERIRAYEVNGYPQTARISISTFIPKFNQFPVQ